MVWHQYHEHIRKFIPGLFHRQSIRLKGYDYSRPGAYYFTICTLGRVKQLGHIENGAIHLNNKGAIVNACWYDLPNHYPYVCLDAFSILPNHVHGVVILSNNMKNAGRGRIPVMGARGMHDVGAGEMRVVGAGLKPAPTKTKIGRAEISTTSTETTETEIDHEETSPGTKENKTTPPERHGFPEIIRALKTFSARRINEPRNLYGNAFWQRGYFEHIIRNDVDLQRIRKYILENAQQWEYDRNNLERKE